MDVLIVTALPQEHDAARDVGLTGCADHPGIASWVERDAATPTPYLLGEYRTAGGHRFSVALARPTRMGGTSTAPVVSALVERLKPGCLAMCGVCAGNPADVALGDVIVAQLAYEYSEGKRTHDSFQADHFPYPMPDTWARAAQDLSTDDLVSFGSASEEDARMWLLEWLHAGDQPRRHPAPTRFFPGRTWADGVRSLQEHGLITSKGDLLSLTGAGRRFIQHRLDKDVRGPERLPFKVFVGPMASGSVVIKDGVSWDQLRQWGVRTVIGLDMEAATIASAAHRLQVPVWVVAKGVMDYADPGKDDRYKRFAARASAEVLFKLLATHPAMGAAAGSVRRWAVDSTFVPGGVTRDGPEGDVEQPDPRQVRPQIGEPVARTGAEPSRWHSAPWWAVVSGIAALVSVLVALFAWWFPRAAGNSPPIGSSAPPSASTPTSTPLAAASAAQPPVGPSEFVDLVREMLCASGSATLNLQNHHSRLYLGGDYERPRLDAGRPPFFLTKAPGQPSGPDRCVVLVRPGADRPNDCLAVAGQVGPGSDVVWMPCDGRGTQQWTIESHWKSEYYEWWEHLHPAQDESLCMQPITTGGVGTPTRLDRCGEAWLQQWKLRTSNPAEPGDTRNRLRHHSPA